MTLIQRILRPVLNYLVETFFPKDAFYGNDFLKAFERAEIDYAPTAISAAGCLLISELSNSYSTECIVTVENISLHGKPVGSWRLIIEEIKEGKENG